MKFILAYIDDLALVSAELKIHIERLKLFFFQKIREGNLTIRLKKSKFLTKQLKYLGHIISK